MGGAIRKGLRQLVSISVATGVIVLALMILAFISSLGKMWEQPQEYWMWEPARLANPWSLLGTVTIALLMLAIPLSHVAWLVLAAIWLSHLAGPHRADENSG